MGVLLRGRQPRIHTCEATATRMLHLWEYHPPICCVPPAAIDQYLPTCWPPKPVQSRPLASTSKELPVAPTGEQQELCFIFNDKGRCFRGSRCPCAHTCTHCGGQHSHRGAQVFAPSTSPSSLRPLTFARYLQQHPNQQQVHTLLTHLTSGFDIGYHGPHSEVRAPNLPSAYVHPDVNDTYIRAECSAGCMAAPFTDPSFRSGLGFPKQDGTWRVNTSWLQRPSASMTTLTQSPSLLAT